MGHPNCLQIGNFHAMTDKLFLRTKSFDREVFCFHLTQFKHISHSSKNKQMKTTINEEKKDLKVTLSYRARFHKLKKENGNNNKLIMMMIIIVIIDSYCVCFKVRRVLTRALVF